MTIEPIVLARFVGDKSKCIMASKRLPDLLNQSEVTNMTGLRTSAHKIVEGFFLD